MTIAAIWVAAALTLPAVQEAQPDRAKLEWFKNLTPERKKVLRERLEALKSLAPEERQRLSENARRWRELPEETRRQIRQRMEKLSPDERRQYAELAQGFFRHLGPPARKAFPRELFFNWARRDRPSELERIRALDPARRREAFEALIPSFREAVLKRATIHARRHRCVPPERLEQLQRADGADFWPAMQTLQRECRAKHGASRPEPFRK
ncbi:MAG: DUF3106 domain-containing protein [Planctomycetes bacterium]|nr:DUF3106 domain-containing protein [Planctomycetota bacterium]